MKICVAGAGAIGGFFAARLAHAGCAVSVLARGKSLEAIRKYGVRLESEGSRFAEAVRSSDRAEELGPQDLVILAIKAPALPGAAESIAALLGPGTNVVPALNGLPWWFFLDAKGALAGYRLRAVDREGILERAVPVSRVVGCVVYPACFCPEPGLVRHTGGSRIVFGEPGGGSSARVERVAELFRGAGFAAESSEDVRSEIWAKVLGNMCFNPVSLLCGCSTDKLIDDGHVHRLFVAMMEEALALALELGINAAIEPESRLASTRKIGFVKTSMLQDAEAGRPVELEGILGTVVEAARAVGLPVPLLSAVYALSRMRAQVLGLLP